MKAVALGLGLLLLATPLAEAGKGNLYAKLSYQHKGSDQYAQPDGTIFDIPHFSQDDSFFYLAYGVSDRVTLNASIVAVRSSDLDDVPDELQRASDFGDVQAGVQVRLVRSGPWTFGVGGILQAPTGNERLSGGLQATGSGVWEGLTFVSLARSLAGKGYGSLEVGPYFRGGGLRDGLSYRAAVSWPVFRTLTVGGNIGGLQRWSETPGTPEPGSFVGFGDGVTYVALGPTVIWKLGGPWGLQADWEALFHARNNTTGDTFRFAVFYQR